MHGYFKKYPICTVQTQTHGVDLKKFQVLGSGKNFRANFFSYPPPPPGVPPENKAVRRYQEFFSTPPPPPVTQQSRPLVVLRDDKGEVANSDFVPFIGDRSEGGCYVVAPPTCGAILIFTPLLGTTKNAGVTLHFCPLMGLREGRGEVANSDYVPFVPDHRECR